ncbi:MAG: FAD-linked oxidase C-terminal domain-containing protein, partial [Candidatus Acidiferrum sp.]
AFYGHFGHGCIHMRINFDLQGENGIRKYAEFIDRAADLVISYGGSLSGEHGDGQSRGALLPKMFGDELMRAFAEFKSIWDPGNKMNPHKVVNAYLPTENLRLGADYKPLEPKTHFALSGDNGSLAQATLRCIGMGACRKQDGGAMCPSYMVTLEEEHSTRGRAHLLFEMLQGEVLQGGWQDEHVKKSLELCLSCKACKSECPANVDLATYRAEFLSHYYEKKPRPLHAHVFGRIDRWARLASPFAGLANFIGRTSVARFFVNKILGLTPQRQLPQLASTNFQRWVRNRRSSASGASSTARKQEVFLWVDTFSNYFHPETCRAALEVLEDAGFHVTTSTRHLCCGRPLYDFGMLDQAKKYLLHIMQELAPQIAAGLPIVVLEPSCASVFRDELVNLFPGNATAKSLRSQTFLLSEFLQHHAPGYQPPKLARKVVVQGHCHHKAIMKMTDEDTLLRRMGVDVNLLDAGCCGMAGAFGFENDKFAVSQAIGERVLLPAIRKESSETLIVADGFSCREQIRQNTGRVALHLAELLALAIEQRNAAKKPEVH